VGYEEYFVSKGKKGSAAKKSIKSAPKIKVNSKKKASERESSPAPPPPRTSLPIRRSLSPATPVVTPQNAPSSDEVIPKTPSVVGSVGSPPLDSIAMSEGETFPKAAVPSASTPAVRPSKFADLDVALAGPQKGEVYSVTEKSIAWKTLVDGLLEAAPSND
jgi:hypothetical protein